MLIGPKNTAIHPAEGSSLASQPFWAGMETWHPLLADGLKKRAVREVGVRVRKEEKTGQGW